MSVRGWQRIVSQAAGCTVVLWAALNAGTAFGQASTGSPNGPANGTGSPYYYPSDEAPLYNYEGVIVPELGAIQARLANIATTVTVINSSSTVTSGNTTTITKTATATTTVPSLVHPFVTTSSTGATFPTSVTTSTGTGASIHYTTTNTTTTPITITQVATAAQIGTATANTVSDLINGSTTYGPTIPGGVTLGSLLSAAIAYAPATANSTVVADVAKTILNLPYNATTTVGFSPSQKEGYLATLAADAVSLVPPNAQAASVTAIIGALATYTKTISNGVAKTATLPAIPADTVTGATLAAQAVPITQEAIDEASGYANTIIAAAITAAKPMAALTAGYSTANSQTLAIAKAGTTEALNDGVGFLLTTITSSAITAGTVVTLSPATSTATVHAGSSSGPIVTQDQISAAIVQGVLADTSLSAQAVDQAVAVVAATTMHTVSPLGHAVLGGQTMDNFAGTLTASLNTALGSNSMAQSVSTAAIGAFEYYFDTYTANNVQTGQAAASIATINNYINSTTIPSLTPDTLFGVIAGATAGYGIAPGAGVITKQAVIDLGTDSQGLLDAVIGATLSVLPTAATATAVVSNAIAQVYVIDQANSATGATIGTDFGNVTGSALKYTQPAIALTIGTAAATAAATAIGLKASTISTYLSSTMPNATLTNGQSPVTVITTEASTAAVQNYLNIMGATLAGGVTAAEAAGNEDAIPTLTSAFAKYLKTFTQTVTLTPYAPFAGQGPNGDGRLFEVGDVAGTKTVITTVETPLGEQTSTVTTVTTVTSVTTGTGHSAVTTKYTKIVVSEVDKTTVQVPRALAADAIAALVPNSGSTTAPTSVAAVVAGIVSAVAVPAGALPAQVAAAGTQAAQVITAALNALPNSANPEYTSVINTAGYSARDVLANKTNFYATTLSYLNGADADNSIAVIYGAGAANPAGIDGIAAAAVVYGQASPSAAILAGVASSPVTASINAKITTAVDVAQYIKTNGITGLGDYLSNQAIVNSTYLADVANGAVVAAPQYAHVIGEALAFRAPSLAAADVVPAIFAFGQLNTPNVLNSNAADVPSRIAAITAGLTTGVINAKLDTSAAALPVTKANTSAVTPTPSTIYNPSYLATTTADLKAIVTAVVKDSLTVTNTVPYTVSAVLQYNTSNRTYSFQTSGTPGVGVQSTAVNPGGAITALVAQLTTPNSGSTPDDDINPVTVGAILKAAATAAGQYYYIPIAEAATEAYLAVSGTSATGFTGVMTGQTPGTDPFTNTGTSGTLNPVGVYADTNGAEIVHDILEAVPAASQSFWITPLQNAVAFAASQFSQGNYGIGAAGILNYQNASATGPYVTSIFDL